MALKYSALPVQFRLSCAPRARLPFCAFQGLESARVVVDKRERADVSGRRAAVLGAQFEDALRRRQQADSLARGISVPSPPRVAVFAVQQNWQPRRRAAEGT